MRAILVENILMQLETQILQTSLFCTKKSAGCFVPKILQIGSLVWGQLPLDESLEHGSGIEASKVKAHNWFFENCYPIHTCCSFVKRWPELARCRSFH